MKTTPNTPPQRFYVGDDNCYSLTVPLVGDGTPGCEKRRLEIRVDIEGDDAFFSLFMHTQYDSQCCIATLDASVSDALIDALYPAARRRTITVVESTGK